MFIGGSSLSLGISKMDKSEFKLFWDGECSVSLSSDFSMESLGKFSSSSSSWLELLSVFS